MPTLEVYIPSIKSAVIELPTSKSIANRRLVLAALSGDEVNASHWGDSDDVRALQRALSGKSTTWDMNLAGTAMRFGLAAACILPGEIVLTGESRLLERPIGPLVDALQQLGADIEYLGEQGFPPLKVSSTGLKGGLAALRADISSQFLSAIALIAPFVDGGIEIKLLGEQVSKPYYEMTLAILEEAGARVDRDIDTVSIVGPINRLSKSIEKDWSAASYFYSVVALAEPGFRLRIPSLYLPSLQGDSIVADIYRHFGVLTEAKEDGLELVRTGENIPSVLEFDCTDFPDLAQTIAATAAGLGVKLHLTGLSTLRVKETDRIAALSIELSKLGAEVASEEAEIWIRQGIDWSVHHDAIIDTYHDHRMAMAFAPLALKQRITINDPEVVRKSFPSFWMEFFKLSADRQE